MAVPGQRHILQISVNEGSAEDFEHSCEPCKKDGNFIEATGYCQNCNEYLCEMCMKHHRRPKPSRHHVLMDKLQMPKNKPKKLNITICTVKCDKHPNKYLEFYCKKHDITGCSDCINDDHKTCDLDSISTVSDGYNTRMDYKYIIYKLEQLQTRVNEALTNERKTAEATDTSVKDAFMNIKQYRQEVNTYLDKTERILLAKSDEIAKSNHLESKKACDKMKTVRIKLASLEKRLTKNTENVANLFALRNESHAQLATIADEMKGIKKPQIKYVEFMKNTALIPTISTEESLGALQLSDPSISSKTQHKRIINMIPKHIKDICTDDCSDPGRSYVTGMVTIRENIIAWTDWFNSTVKLVDIKHDELLSTVSDMGKPWDITSITDNTLAVTLTYSQKIQFIEVMNNTLMRMGDIDVKGKCRGIDCIDGKLVVSYEEPPKVEILDFCGNIMRELSTDRAGNDIFNCLYHVVMSRDGGSIYVSDSKNESISKFSLNGKVQATYRDKDLNDPRGMFVCRDGSVLVCSAKSVHVISEDCKKQKILINEEDGVWFPQGICYDEDNGILCVRKYGDGLSDIILVFRTA